MLFGHIFVNPAVARSIRAEGTNKIRGFSRSGWNPLLTTIDYAVKGVQNVTIYQQVATDKESLVVDKSNTYNGNCTVQIMHILVHMLTISGYSDHSANRHRLRMWCRKPC